MRFKINGFLEGRKKKFSPGYPKQNKKQRIKKWGDFL